MDPLVIIGKIQKRLKQEIDLVAAVMVEGVDNHDKYKYLVGQAQAYGKILQEISNLLEEKEQNEQKGTVIDIKNTPTK